MKRTVLAPVMALATAVCGAATTITVHSVEDVTTGRWVGDAAKLVEALETCTSTGDKIILEKGDYDLSGIKMEDDPSRYGISHLRIAPGVSLVAKEDDRSLTRLVGDGTCRVLRVVDPDYKTTYVRATLCGITVTNGYARSVSGADDSKHGGGFIGNATLTNCTVTCCRADGNGGGLYGFSFIYRSSLLNNVAATSGGGAYKASYVDNSLVSGNVAGNNGGGLAGFTGAEKVYGTTVTGNSAGRGGGGILMYCVVSNCVVSLNSAKEYGGGLYNTVLQDVAKYVATDSLICSNKVDVETDAYCAGGGAKGYTIVGRSVFGNYGKNGGGTYDCVLTNVVVHNNYAPGFGGGISSSTAYDCVVSNNFAGTSGPNAMSSSMYRCRIVGTGVVGGMAADSVFRHIGQREEIAFNPHAVGVKSVFGNMYEGSPVCTNCLFTDIRLDGDVRSLFMGASTTTRSMRIVNCTIVDNVVGRTFNNAASADFPAEIKNSVFVWNSLDNSTPVDICANVDSSVSSSGIRFYNCAYGTATGLFSDMSEYAGGDVYRFGHGGFGKDPKFVLGEGEHPYEPKMSSPLRGRGAVERWMLSASDIRGGEYARLRDGKADIGCYQCWLEQRGTVLLMR